MKIAIYILGQWGLGDRLCMLPAFKALRKQNPGSEIWVIGDICEPFKRCKDITECVLTEPNGFNWDKKYEMRLFTHMSLEEYAKLEAMPCLVDHMATYLGVECEDKIPVFPLKKKEIETANRVERDYFTFCSDFPDVRRGWDHYFDLVKMLQATGLKALQVGTGPQLDDSIPYVKDYRIGVVAAIIKNSRFFVSNNTGLVQFAQCVDTPCVVLYSLALPERFIFKSHLVSKVQADIECKNCMTKDFATMHRAFCTHKIKGCCMKSITVEMVLQKCLELK